MRALAEFVMRGRVQAISVAIAGVVLPFFVWVSAAVVGLVTLRRSGQDAILVLGWSLLAAAAVMLLHGGINPAVFGVLIGSAIATWVLRWSRSWAIALTAVAAIGLASAASMLLFGGALLERTVASTVQLVTEMSDRMSAEEALVFRAMMPQQADAVSGAFGCIVATGCLAVLLLARWWQAMLYNPGGFRAEIHSLRLPLPLAIGLIGLAVLMGLFGAQYWLWWSPLLRLPLVVAGFALVHGVVGLKRWGIGPLIALYVVCLPLGGLVMSVLLLLAIIDSRWDFRGRLAAKQQRQQ